MAEEVEKIDGAAGRAVGHSKRHTEQVLGVQELCGWRLLESLSLHHSSSFLLSGCIMGSWWLPLHWLFISALGQAHAPLTCFYGFNHQEVLSKWFIMPCFGSEQENRDVINSRDPVPPVLGRGDSQLYPLPRCGPEGSKPLSDSFLGKQQGQL